MPESGIILDYQGQVDLTVIELLLEKLKNNRDFASLGKLTGKRTYAIVVECLENIYKHSDLKSSNDPNLQPNISVRNQNDKIFIIACNPVAERTKNNLVTRLDKINKLDEAGLKNLHEHIITGRLKNSDNGAGLGLISIALKSGNKIGYRFGPLIDGFINCEIQITLNR
jgi:hypothetical protein